MLSGESRSGQVRKRRANGGLESEVLAALWAADRSLTAADMVEALGGELAHTTVQTILTRLHAKGAVTREFIGRAHAYTPVLDEAGLAADRMRAMLEKSGDHAAVLSRFLRTLTPEDSLTLTELMRHRGRKR
jgi:predicted transcriptional regulator